jgi:hypothetical protein
MSSVLAKLKKKDLVCTEQMLGLHAEAVSQNLIGENDQETFLALAELAPERGRLPAALFRWFLKNPDSWSSLTNGHRTVAQRRIEDFASSQPALPTQQVARSGRSIRRVEHKHTRGLKKHFGIFPERDYSADKMALIEADARARESDAERRKYVRRQRIETLIGLTATVAALLWLAL